MLFKFYLRKYHKSKYFVIQKKIIRKRKFKRIDLMKLLNVKKILKENKKRNCNRFKLHFSLVDHKNKLTNDYHVYHATC